MVWGVVYYSRWSSDSALKESYIPKWGGLGGGCWSFPGRQVANCLEQDLQDFLGFSGWRGSRRHRCARTSAYERSRVFASVYVCWAGCLERLGGLSEQDLQDFGIGIFRMVFAGLRCWACCSRMGEDLLLVRALDERLRAFTRDHECLRVFTSVGRVVWSRICRISWDFQDGGGPLAVVRSYERWTRDCERSREIVTVF